MILIPTYVQIVSAGLRPNLPSNLILESGVWSSWTERESEMVPTRSTIDR